MPPAHSRQEARTVAKSKLQALRSSRSESGKTNLNHIGLGTSQIATIRRLAANKQLHFATHPLICMSSIFGKVTTNGIHSQAKEI